MKKIYLGPWEQNHDHYDRRVLGTNKRITIVREPSYFKKYISLNSVLYRFWTINGAKKWVDKQLMINNKYKNTKIVFLTKEQFDKLQVLL
jgi:hypothetical protein